MLPRLPPTAVWMVGSGLAAMPIEPMSPVGWARMSPTASTTFVPSSAPGSQAFIVLDMPFWPIISP